MGTSDTSEKLGKTKGVGGNGNLIPPVKGEVRNPNGRPKGSKSWSTVVRDLLADEELTDKVITKKPSWWDALPTKNGMNAVAIAMLIKSLNGDKQAAEWLRKTGYGDKVDVDITSAGKPIPILATLDVPSDNGTQEDTDAT